MADSCATCNAFVRETKFNPGDPLSFNDPTMGECHAEAPQVAMLDGRWPPSFEREWCRRFEAETK